MMRLAWLVAIPVLLAADPSAIRGQERPAEAGVVVTTAPVNAQRVAELQEIARIGRIDGQAEYQLSRVTDLVVDRANGEVFVADGLDRRVRVFSRTGTFLRAWGRTGEGPGEFAGSPFVAVARDTVMVSDGVRVHAFLRSGQHLSTIVPRAALNITFIDAIGPDPAGWKVTLREIEPGVTGSTPFRRSYRLSPRDGITPEWVHQERHPGPVLGVLGHRPVSVFHGAGFADAPSPAYEIHLYSQTGAILRILRFQDVPVPVAPSALREYAETVREQCQRSPIAPVCLAELENRLREVSRIGLPDVRPVVRRLVGSASGLILVERADLDPTPLRPDGRAPWDLVRDDGTWLARVPFPDRFVPRWLGEDEVWGVQTDDLEVHYVVGFRLRVPPP